MGKKNRRQRSPFNDCGENIVNVSDAAGKTAPTKPKTSKPKATRCRPARPARLCPPSGDQLSKVPPAQTNCRAVQTGDYDWQYSKETLKSRTRYLLFNEVLADVCFTVGKNYSQQKIPAHRLLLAMSSSVFNVMFSDSWPDKYDEVVLPDIEPDALRNLLTFIYTDEIHITADNVLATWYCAKKYLFPVLERACVTFLESNVTSDNAVLVLQHAKLYDEPGLIRVCHGLIDVKAVQSFAVDSFTEIDFDSLCALMERDSLCISQMDLLEAALRWAEAECKRQNLSNNVTNQKLVLGKAFDLIRFSKIDPEDFAEKVHPMGLLTCEEMNELYRGFILSDDSLDSNPKILE